MASPEAMGVYYKGYPKQDDSSTWNGAHCFSQSKPGEENAAEALIA